ncbi:hypothetical protein [Nocardia altamirensis]|uniref:hypothetical protein n=1 Tax=Nocardia altamirensis TaxID=472158 RepID=UPI0008407386|nr:hypothetical protein [Nocardia altamirensis]
MDTAELIISCPRGRRVCAELVAECDGGFLGRVWEAAGRIAGRDGSSGDPAAGVAAAIQAFGADAIERLSEEIVVGAVAEATDFARYWQEPDEFDRVYAQPSVVTALRSVADALVRSPPFELLNSPVDRAGQRWVQWWHDGGWYPEQPSATGDADMRQWRNQVVAAEERARRELGVDPNDNWSGEWWSTPSLECPATSRALPWLGALRLAAMEDSMGWERARVWPVALNEPVRVLEIDGPTAWRALVDAYPLRVTASRRHDWYRAVGRNGEWFIPDWAAVGAEYDAVHLSAVGYLTTPGRAIDVAGGATVLAGWDPDLTYWLRRDRFVLVDDPVEWRRIDGQWRRAI